MPRTLGRFWIFLVLLAGVAWPVVVPAAASPGVTSAIVGTSIRSVYVRTPRGSVGLNKPLQVLLALHGMGGNGEEFSRDLLEQADKYGWLIVAPTIEYGDWTSPVVVAREDPVLINALADYLDQLPDLMGVQTRRQILIIGHSRGAQLAHRFAEFRPEKVLAVAALSAGTYTLPQGGLTFPYGIQDMAQYTGRSFNLSRFNWISFWVGVGGADTNPADVPRQWDSIEGSTRVQRAQTFDAAMQRLGAHTVLRVFGNAKHEMTTEMRLAACAFLGNAMQPQPIRIKQGSADPLPF